MPGDGFAALAFVVAVATMALWFRRIAEVRIPENRGAFVAAWLGAVALGVIALLRGTSGFIGTAPAILAIALGAFGTFTFLISRQQASAEGLRLGEPLTGFEARDEHEEVFDLASLAGRPVLLKFFRGHW
jgi:hypothetical protein